MGSYELNSVLLKPDCSLQLLRVIPWLMLAGCLLVSQALQITGGMLSFP